MAIDAPCVQEKITILLESLSPLTANWLRSRLRVQDNRTVVQVMVKSNLYRQLEQRHKLTFVFGEGVMN